MSTRELFLRAGGCGSAFFFVIFPLPQRPALFFWLLVPINAKSRGWEIMPAMVFLRGSREYSLLIKSTAL